MYFSQSQIKKINIKIFINIALILIMIGLIWIYSSSSIYALEHYKDEHYFLKKQIIGLLCGTIGFIVCSNISLTILYKYTPLFFWSSLLLTSCTLWTKFARNINGSKRWIMIAGQSFQPSELIKITFILYCAYLLTKHKKKHDNISFSKSYLPFLVLISIISIILLQQPDFGLTITLATTVLLLLFIAEIPIIYLATTIILILPIITILIYKFPYRLQRILVFLNPWKDPQGNGFQIIQSLIAIGSGNWFGIGLSNSKQKFFYLPMQHTDFIFSIIAEEIGFIGITFILFLYMLFAYYGLNLAYSTKNLFHKFSITGFIILITLQTIINVCVTSGLLPTKGIGLPFISYGNSSLFCLLSILGLIKNMSLAKETI